MKNTYCIFSFILFLSLNLPAQNWQIFNSSEDRFFIGNVQGGSQPVSYTGLIHAYHVDSVKILGADSVFYLFNSMWYQGSCYDTAGPSYFAGDKVIIRANGENILFNANNDTICVNTLKNLNDSFLIHKSVNGDYITGIVTSTGISTVLGQPDSVKVITVQARDISDNPIQNPFNGTHFSISKNYGMVQGYTWSIFPVQPDTFLFTRISASRLTVADVFNYNTGDIFQFRQTHYTPSAPPGYTEYVISGKWYSANSDTLYYERQVAKKDFIFVPNPSPHLDSVMSAYTDTIFYTNLSDELYNGAYPEETILGGVPSSYQMFRDPALYNGRTYISHFAYNYYYNGTCYTNNPVGDHVHDYHVWIEGCGMFQSSYDNNNSGGPIWYTNDLVYYKKGSEEYGTPLLISSIDEKGTGEIKVVAYPNPANDKLYMKGVRTGTQFIIYDITGRKVMTGHCTGETSLLNIEKMQPGAYFLEVREKQNSATIKIIVE